MTFPVIFAVYLLGGITFIPILLVLLFLHAYLSFPIKQLTQDTGSKNDPTPTLSSRPSTAFSNLDTLPEELKVRPIVPDAAAGYFAVCREYTPGGSNGKPPERSAQTPTSVAPESPSVYQSMYRSVFDRNKPSTPTSEGSKIKNKRSRNVFYIVLRLGHLMMYDDSDQLEVRHVLSLAHYKIDIYAGGEEVPEGELWIKRNCLRLSQTSQLQTSTMDSKPYYLFSDNSSEKEDFYHAMLLSQDKGPDLARPEPLGFDSTDAVKLVQQLHASEETLHTRWINALIGRLFLALYKTKHVEQLIWTKITKKIARVPKPAFISNVHVRKIDMGHLPPFITNPKLRELTIEGDMVVEADVSYKGNFKLEISAVARIELGTRFKPREVTLILASILKKLEGHILLRIKPPPSNRIWVSFETVPKMELSLEPIVSTRQITYGVILRAIENRIREVVSETLVYPNWDDIPFSDSLPFDFRGGLWADTEKPSTSESLEDQQFSNTATGGIDLDVEASPISASHTLQGQDTQDVIAVSSGLAQHGEISTTTDSQIPLKPKAMRSGSFSSVASPLVDLNVANASVTATTVSGFQEETTISPGTLLKRGSKAPQVSTAGVPNQDNESGRQSPIRSMSSRHNSIISEEYTSQSDLKAGSSQSWPPNAADTVDKRQAFNQSLSSAMAAGKKWFIARQTSTSPSVTHDTVENSFVNPLSQNALPSMPSDEGVFSSPTPPMGRGQPLPPPGTPLPSPRADKRWAIPTASAFANIAKRKPGLTKASTSSLDMNNSHGISEPSSLANRTLSMPHGTGGSSISGSTNSGAGSRRKLSSVQSGPFPASTTRRTRVSNPEVPVQELFVVEAPLASPKDHEQEGKGREDEAASGIADGVADGVIDGHLGPSSGINIQGEDKTLS